ncbi:MAG: hypothetical protein IKR31_03340 [Prevotella sp.]|nr:hypothetical protein [Prevotella sp.]
MSAPDPNHISAKPVLSSHVRKADGKTLIPVNEWQEGVCRAVTTRSANISYKNLFPGQIYPLTAVLIEYED